jgi:uncharacterized protein (TIGR02145 family)
MKKVSLIFSTLAISALMLTAYVHKPGQFKSVKIGNQTWMVENLNVDRFRNGDPIPEAKTREEWMKAGEEGRPAWCYYNNDPKNGAKYGKLYNWYAVNDSRGLAPAGWHIPTDAEWQSLIDYLGDDAGKQMKATSGWWEGGNGTNSNGFSALPGGYRSVDGTFTYIGGGGCWWGSTEYYANYAWGRGVYGNSGGVSGRYDYKLNGFSVRCLKDSLVIGSFKSEDKVIINQELKSYNENPFYWEFKGNPVLLIGGSNQDNLFNHPNLSPGGLEANLDLLFKCGGNYVRNNMSHRDSGNIFAFNLVNGRFDLSSWNEEYWELFDNFLQLTSERDIIVQIELWATWDYYIDFEVQSGWSKNPFNPINNINYSLGESGLLAKVDFYPTHNPTSHNFFHTVPALENNTVVLPWQQALINKILSYTFNYSHILYCINNETGEPTEWSDYWAKFIQMRAGEEGIEVPVTDMKRLNDINSNQQHRHTHDNPDIFSFIEVSQNNGGQNWQQPESRHWLPLIELREYLQANELVRPINNTKIYGGEDGWGGKASRSKILEKYLRRLRIG